MKREATLDAAHDLQDLLDETVADAREREGSAFANVLKPSSGRVVIYGAGNLGKLVLAGLRESGVMVSAFADKNPALWSQTVEGVRVYNPEEAAATFDDDLFLVAVCHPTRTGGMESVLRSLRGWGCRHLTSFVPLFWHDPDRYLPYYMWDLPSRLLEAADRVRAGFRLFEGDLESQTHFVEQIRFRLYGDFGCLRAPSADKQYFPDLFQPLPDECFVDCGAYNGDSIGDFLDWSNGRFLKIIAFEPDPTNAAALADFAEARGLAGRIELKTAAVGDRAGFVSFAASGGTDAAISECGNVQVACLTLDQTLESRASFLKMDIEGAELAALKGATKLLRRDRPIAAVCVYHRQEHLWDVPLCIAAQLDRARFYLINYCMDGFETLCYAVPEERVFK